MAERKDDFFSRILTPSRKEAVFTRKVKKAKVYYIGFPQDLLTRTTQVIRNSMKWSPMVPIISPMILGTVMLIDNVMKKAHCPLNADHKQTCKEYANELIKAKGQLDHAAGIWEADPCNLEAKRQLEDALLHLQGLALQGPPSFRILMEYVKEVSEEVDRLVDANNSCAIESQQEINDSCGEIKIKAERILENYNAKEYDGLSTVTDETIDEFVDFEKETEKRMELINQIIQWLPDSKDRILLNSKFVDLQAKHIKLRFAAQSIRAANRLVYLNDNFQDVLNVEDKIKQILLAGNVQCSSSYNPESLPRSTSSALLEAMLSSVSQRHLGTALMQYMDDPLTADHSAQCCIKQKLQEKLRKPINILKQLLMMMSRRVIYWENYLDDDVTSTMEKVIEAVSEVCVCQPHRKIWLDIDFCLFKANLKVRFSDDDEERKIEDLQEWATQITQSLVLNIDFMNTGVRTTTDHISIVKLVNYLAWTAQSLKRSDEPVFNASIEEAVRNIIIQTLDLAESYKLANPMRREPLAIEGRSEDLISESMIYQEPGMAKGPLKVRPPASTTYTARAIGVGAIATGRLEEIPAEEFMEHYFSEGNLESEGPFDSPGSSQSDIISSGRFKATECAGKFSEPVYLKGAGSSRAGRGSGSGGGSSEASGEGTGEGSGVDRGDGTGSSQRGQGGVQSSSASESSPSDSTPNCMYHRQFIDACRLLNELINNLCRILSRDRMRSDCGELVRNLRLQQAVLQNRQPTCTLSYEECLDRLGMQQEVIPMLNSDDPMPMVAFWRNLRFISSAVCKSTDFAAQCAYLILVSESNTDAPKIGVVDVCELQSVLKTGQTICYKMLALQPEEAKEESFRLIKQVQHIVKSLTEAGKKAQGLKAELDRSVLEVHKCAMELSGSFEQSDTDEVQRYSNYQERISAATMQMLICLKTVNKLTEHPTLTPSVPAARTVSDNARSRSDQVLRSAKLLTNNTLSLVQEVKRRSDYVSRDDTIRWSAFELTRRDVVSAYEELINNVRSNGQLAGILA